ncbi:GIN domain-containing protein [Croceitalea vernalis]|uniref:DUF2807 domain-containing protein n=1 Tax=Croceitalea vernalis TaxID=3075599 RepID=A0ABU3BFQ6_9FLAO|nr:DUF2807 domain-containing protein [Croceitalea sp. P007]MDT0621000.1 DUF2807 domain-containing protein [Croceitalea sp. P007]
MIQILLDDFFDEMVSNPMYHLKPVIMKKYVLILIASLPIMSMAQRKPKIKGNRSVIEVREELPPFNAIELNDNLDIELKKSFGEGYEIIADDNLIDILKFQVVDSTLVISSFYDVTAKKKLEIIVNYKELKAITQRDGKIECEDIIKADELYINVFGPSKLKLKADAFVAYLNLEDNSNSDFSLDVDSLDIKMKHRSDAKIYAVTGAKHVELLNNAALSIDGSTDTLQLKAINNARFKGEKMQSGGANIVLEESSVARVFATRDLELQSRGTSKTYLYGDPRISILEFLDTSQLIKKKN